MGAKLGQHFLTSEDVARRIVFAAGVKPGEQVLEIGPGEGFLTLQLLDAGAHVTAVELDRALAAKLPQAAGDGALKVIHGDFLKLAASELPTPVKIAANLPYAVASPILQKILSWDGWTIAVLMFQKEVAERILAKPGGADFGLLTLSVQLHADAESICEAPRRFFNPPPRVDSAVVKLTRRHASLLPAGLSEPEFFRVARMAFQQRRKTVLNGLSMGLKLPKAEVTAKLEAAGIDPQSRPEDIPLERWLALAAAFLA